MFFSFDVDNFLLYKERKTVIIQKRFWIDIENQILGVPS